MQKITPNFWFDKEAEDAARLYTSLFSNSKIGAITSYDQAAAEASGQAKGSAPRRWSCGHFLPVRN